MRKHLRLGALFVLLGGLPAPASARNGPASEAWVGRFAMELRVVNTAKLPMIPSQRNVTTSLMLVDLDRGATGGNMLVQRHEVCDVRVAGSSVFRTVVPRAFIDGLPARDYPAVLPSVQNGWRYTADLGIEAIGFDPDETGGALPAGPADPGVRDTDDDGEPGATVELRIPAVGKVRLFIAQRSHLVLDGVPKGPDRIAGRVGIRVLEQRTLGADPGFFNRTPAIRPDADGSGFTLVRVPDWTGCAGIRQDAGTLFE